MKNTFLFLIINILIINTLFAQKNYLLRNGDTINVVDANGLKQGTWFYFSDKYKNNISQEGTFLNNKKEEIWITYSKNGNIRTYMTFKDGVINGEVRIYNRNGVLQESGKWDGNKWTGEYKFFYDNGNPEYIWTYNESGERTGVQKYFYEDNSLLIEGYWDRGKEIGIHKEYYQDGRIKRESNWVNGIINGISTEYYATGEVKIVRRFENGVLDKNSVVYYTLENTNDTNTNNNTNNNTNENNTETTYNTFTGTGFNTFYNGQHQVIKEGEFKNGILVDGKKFFYNETGKLVRVDIYEDGKVIRVERPENN